MTKEIVKLKDSVCSKDKLWSKCEWGINVKLSSKWATNLTLRKIALWVSKTCHFFQKNCQKLLFFAKKLPDCQKIAKNLTFFSKKLPKIVIFFKKIASGNLLEKIQFMAFFSKKMSSFWQFFDSQMAIFRRVRLTY